MATARYHHGDLKTVLLALAESEVEASGHEALELQALAAQAGVSKAAPYRHFRNRQDLLIALGARGFALLKERNAQAVAQEGDARQRLRNVCLALVAFAAERPQLYRLMFGSDVMRRYYSPETWGDVVRESFALFEASMAATMIGATDRQVRMATLACLASLQGFILLRNSARMEYLLMKDDTDEMLLDRILATHLDPGQRSGQPVNEASRSERRD